MFIQMCKSKIKGGTVTDKNIHYDGSITLDLDIIKAADLLVGEMVHVLNINNGARIETYVIEGPAGSGTICINGAAARLFEKTDQVIILSVGTMDREEALRHSMKVITLGKNNSIART